MNRHNRRKFLKELALAGGAVTLGADALNAFSFFKQEGKKKVVTVKPKTIVESTVPIDFRYSPSTWQSTFCFPDDPYKSLVGKYGELLYNHPGLLAELDAFAQKVWFGLNGTQKGEYIEQKLEAPGIPIITTKLRFPDAVMTLTTFATNSNNEGRVDNVLVQIRPDGKEELDCAPFLTISSKAELTLDEQDDDLSTLLLGDENKTLFLAVNAHIEMSNDGTTYTCTLAKDKATASSPLNFFFRFPQAAQELDAIEDGIEEPQKLLDEARLFWQNWKPFDGKVNWQIQDKHHEFLITSTRNILQSRTIKEGKKAFQVGPTVYRGLWVIDGTFLLEAARYMGHDKEAQEGLESIWNLQNSAGGIFAGGGENHWKDTAAAIYMLIRQAELSQNWDYFNELWPDAHKAAMYLRNLRDKAYRDGTANGSYGLLPQGFGDSGIGGVRSELTNSLWTVIGLKAMQSTADRLFLMNRGDIRDFYRELWISFRTASQQETRQHQNGFKFLPMLMKDDPKWNDPNPLNRPNVQAAQIYMSHAIYPGMLYDVESAEVLGHIDLMKSIVQEDIPAETGWLAHDAVWAYNAPIVSQVLLWAGQPQLARNFFNGFLNHASPMYAWREEQTLRSIADERFIGDMPHNWASAECIRYLRHSFILEDETKLRLLDGLVEGDLNAQKPFSFTYSPTRWGRITLTLEPLDERSWKMKFKREDFNEKMMPKFEAVEFPRKISKKHQLDKVEGVDVKWYKNGGRVIVEPNCLEWEAIWRIFGQID
ncbi:MAG: twin-arginine translocation signal domain-containing protein [Ignavibacteriae bacterium]|nr:twin-arginine translocation signal domain-containing protein [Ignavibacteriota bacterium]